MKNVKKRVIMYRLIADNGRPLAIGDTVETFRGVTCVLKGWECPRHPRSTGRVYIQADNSDCPLAAYPSVIGAKFVYVYVPTSDQDRITSERDAVCGGGEA